MTAGGGNGGTVTQVTQSPRVTVTVSPAVVNEADGTVSVEVRAELDGGARDTETSVIVLVSARQRHTRD